MYFFQVPSVWEASGDMMLKFAGKTTATSSLVLLTFLRHGSKSAKLTVNCDKIVIGNMLVKEIKQAFE